MTVLFLGAPASRYLARGYLPNRLARNQADPTPADGSVRRALLPLFLAQWEAAE